MMPPRLEVAEVFRDHGDAFLDRYGDTLRPEQRRALSDIAACRTAALGGHVEECDQCAHRLIAYNSCLMESKFLCRALRDVRAYAHCLQLVPQPPLPQVPGHRRGAVDGGSRI